VTIGFAYLLIFLGGFTLALVTGFARRLLHPTELCDHVVVPSPEHLSGLRSPIGDVAASFLTLFGLTCLLVHGLLSLGPGREIAIGTVAGLFGIVALRSWLRQICNPAEQLVRQSAPVRVVREIPASGYGQVEVRLEGRPLKLAARSEDRQRIAIGTVVEILDRSESVAVVKRLPASP
jgi:membrane protein implicated in regulation of membrane protease activity